MKKHRARTVAGTASVLLVCLALLGCGNHGSASQPNGPGPQASGSPANANGSGAGDSAGGSGAVGSRGPSGAPTQDPVASELDQLNQLINGIDNSVQNSDSSSQGGE